MHPLLRHTALLFVFLTLSYQSQAIDSKGYSSHNDEFESFKNSQNTQFDDINEEFALYKKQLLSAFEDYKAQVSTVWGDSDSIAPGSKNLINYQDDLSHRSIIDFEKGTVDIEIAVADKDKLTDKQIRTQLQQTIIKSLKQGTDKRSFIDIAKQPVSKPTGNPVLAGMIAKKDGSSADDSDYKQLAAQASIKIEKKRVKGNDGQDRIIYKAQLHLVPNHVKKRAQSYKSQIELSARQQKVPSAMILAIMETESMFNPVARSPVPAFGLMQLVPTSGARDAYRHLYKKDRVVNDTYLYKPENNIKLGAAYLNRLYYGYLKGIKDPISRQWASIAAYNTGAGNVFRTFAGKYKKSRFGSRKKWKQIAYAEINKMTPDQVYTFMHKRLPYVETRKYIKKVAVRMKKYET